jgi:polysaccharide pyruvyl transferase WcaK-like protein
MTPAGAISFFGNFGTLNLGNECTLQAAIHHVRRCLPQMTVNCICPAPEEASARHAIPAYRMSRRYRKDPASTAPAPRRRSRLGRLERIALRIPAEVMEWIKAFQTLEGTRMLVMPGTGMLGDFGIGPFDLHYEIFKWSILAKLRGCRLMFVSVGAGRIAHPLSRWLVRCALSLADYRSYRDSASRQHLQSIGVDTRRDAVYPDLAFSLPGRDLADTHARNGGGAVVGLGLMEYYGKGCSPERGEGLYREYVDKISAFVVWLLEHDYSVRLLIGDLAYDRRVKQDVAARVEQRGHASDGGRLIDEPVESVDEILSQLAATDMVVATRFHTVLLALMLNKPVISISYDPKNDSLMAGVGLGEYCQHIERLDVPRLVAQFIELGGNTARFKPYARQKAEEYRLALDEQYRRIFN